MACITRRRRPEKLVRTADVPVSLDQNCIEVARLSAQAHNGRPVCPLPIDGSAVGSNLVTSISGRPPPVRIVRVRALMPGESRIRPMSDEFQTPKTNTAISGRGSTVQREFRQSALLVILLLGTCGAFATNPDGELVRRLSDTPHPYTTIQPWHGKLVLRRPSAAPYEDVVVLFDPTSGLTKSLSSLPHSVIGPWVDPEDDGVLLFANGKSLLALDPITGTLAKKEVPVTLTSSMRVVGHQIHNVMPDGKFEVINEASGAIESTGTLPRGYQYRLRWDGGIVGENRDHVVVIGPRMTGPMEFPYNSNLSCWHDNFQQVGDLLIVQTDCGTLTIFDRSRGATVATLHPVSSGEVSFVVSRGLIFTLPWAAQSGGPPAGRVYDAATGRELDSFLAGGRVLAVTDDRLVTSESVYVLDRSQLTPGVQEVAVLRAFPESEALAALDHLPYRAIERLDDSGMYYIAGRIIERKESVPSTLQPVVDQYARWLSLTVSRYQEARALIEALNGERGDHNWEPLLAWLSHLDVVLRQGGRADARTQPTEPVDTSAHPLESGRLDAETLPSALIQAWHGPLPAGWRPYLDGLRRGAFVGDLFVMPGGPCAVDIYAAGTLEYQKRLLVDRCLQGALAGAHVAAVAASSTRLYVLMNDQDSDDQPENAAASESEVKPNLVIFDSATLQELGRYPILQDASELGVSSDTLVACECTGSVGASCTAYSLTSQGQPDTSRGTDSASPVAQLGCIRGSASQSDAAHAISILASGDRPYVPEAINGSFMAVRSQRPGASGFDSVDILRLAPPHGVVSQQLPLDAYSFRDFLSGHNELALVAREDREDNVYAAFDVAGGRLLPILDVPKLPLDRSTSNAQQIAVAGDWFIVSLGRDVLLRQISSPGVLYVAHFGGSPDFLWLRLFPSPHWVVVDRIERTQAPKPEVILLDPLSSQRAR